MEHPRTAARMHAWASSVSGLPAETHQALGEAPIAFQCPHSIFDALQRDFMDEGSPLQDVKLWSPGLDSSILQNDFSRHVPRLLTEGLYNDDMTESAKFAVSLGMANSTSCYSKWSFFTDGSYKHYKKDDKTVSVWAFVIVVEDATNASTLNPSGYSALAHARGPLSDDHRYSRGKQSSGLAEIVAIINALLVIVCHQPAHATIHFDALPIGRAVEGQSAPTQGIEEMVALAVGLRQIADLRTTMAFIHVNSHDGSPWNDVADALAKEACEGDVDCAPSPLPECWIGQDSVYANWAWVYSAAPVDLFNMGMPPFEQGQFQCTPFNATTLDAGCLGITPEPEPSEHMALLSLKFGSSNLNVAVDDKTVRGVHGRDEFIRQQFHDAGLHVVGVQEGNGRKKQTLSSTNYVRLVAGPVAPSKVGDVEFWYSKALSWGKVGPRDLFVREQDFTVVFAEQKSMYVALRCNFCRLDFLVMHGPHSWGSKTKTEAQATQEAVAFWESLSSRIAKN